MLQKYLKILRDLFIDKYATKIYSQDGKDFFVLKYFKNKKDSFFVDIGAQHTKRFFKT